MNNNSSMFIGSFNEILGELELPNFILDAKDNTQCKVVNIINETVNIKINPDFENLPESWKEIIGTILYFSGKIITIGDLEEQLVDKFGENKEYATGDGRISVAFGWANTNLHRNAESIILPGTSMSKDPSIQKNIGGNCFDNIGWASRSLAPNKAYGILGKIPECRPMAEEYNPSLHDELLNTKIKISECLGFALEVSKEENAIMPVFKVSGGEDKINPFSATIKPGTIIIPTAKKYIIDTNPYGVK